MQRLATDWSRDDIEAFLLRLRRFIQQRRPVAIDAEWEEGKHPRGQPGNAGQFGAGGSSESERETRVKTSFPVADLDDLDEIYSKYNRQYGRRDLGDLTRFPIETIPIRYIVATQDRVTLEKIEHYRKNKSDELPSVFSFNGEFYLIDGTHRAEAEKKNGGKNIKAHVITIK
jgi:hypothetical protein